GADMWTSRTDPSPVKTSWRGDEILVTQGAGLIDRLRASDIERVTLIHRGAGESPGEVRAALFEMTARAVLLRAASGVAGSVLFEHQAYWSHRNCIYWVSDRCVAWASAASATRWPFGRTGLAQHRTLSPADAALLFERAAVTGPHTWDQRKQYRIERRRPFPGWVSGATPINRGALVQPIFMSHHRRPVDARASVAA
ncbi:MAG TPA: hypothetical protein VFK10_19820, partial [Burkholderiaceae bacterium]|nr:hypothetical protein [Burkholderiaceae bacterium]